VDSEEKEELTVREVIKKIEEKQPFAVNWHLDSRMINSPSYLGPRGNLIKFDRIKGLRICDVSTLLSKSADSHSGISQTYQGIIRKSRRDPRCIKFCCEKRMRLINNIRRVRSIFKP
jgi:hypothetical protein